MVMGYVVGGALSTPLVAKTQMRWGRKVSFQIGLAVAVASAALFAWAAFSRNFELVQAGTGSDHSEFIPEDTPIPGIDYAVLYTGDGQEVGRIPVFKPEDGETDRP